MDPIERWQLHRTARGFAPGTIKLQARWVTRMATTIGDPLAATAETIDLWLASHRAWKPATRSSAICALRGFYTWAHDTGLIADNPTTGLHTPRVHAPTKPVPATINEARLSHLDETTRMMVRIALATGLRRAEIATIHSGDVRSDDLGWWLSTTGKGAKTRSVALPDDLADWIRGRDGWAFPTADGHITPDAVAARIRRATGVGPHALRRLAATTWNENTKDVRSIQLILGHSSLATTQRYLGASRDTMRRAAMSTWVAG